MKKKHDDNVNSSNSIPPMFQYVWVGGEIRPEYLSTILKISAAAFRSGFEETIIWTDNDEYINEPLRRSDLKSLANKYNSSRKKNTTVENMHHQSAHQSDSKLPLSAETLDIPMHAGNFHIKIKNINELLDRLKTDPIFPDKETNAYIYNLLRESIGNRNLAAVSDLIRYCSLYYDGGYYLDTDLQPTVDSTTRLVPDKPPLGMIGHIRQQNYPEDKLRIAYLMKMPLPLEVDGNNDAFGVVPRHPILRVAIQKMLAAYAKQDVEPIILKDISAEKIGDRIKDVLTPFERNFVSQLKKDKATQTEFIKSLLNQCFELRLLDNVNFNEMELKNSSHRTPSSVAKDKQKTLHSIEHLITEYTKQLKIDNFTHEDIKQLSKKLIQYVQEEIKIHQETYNLGYEGATEMDAKRYPFAVKDTNNRNKRRHNTCEASINSFCEAIEAFLVHKEPNGASPYTDEELATFSPEKLTKSHFAANVKTIQAPGDYEVAVKLAGCEVTIKCDKTWLHNTKSKVSYDENALPAKKKTGDFFASSKNEGKKTIEQNDTDSRQEALTIPDKNKLTMSIMKIPLNEREENILAVYTVLKNDELLRNSDSSVPAIIRTIRDIVVNIDPSKEENISNAIIEIKRKIAENKDNNYNKNADDIIKAFAKPSCCDFQKIRAALTANPIMDEIMKPVTVGRQQL
ncbi:Mannosyltransferase OCH1 and related enzymes [Fluoribacter dumoffii]|uniref:Mannosyltransferase OCH1 and related enzymes n=2 Tax=Fluoribacter dumoffii TaxID=463 RepID=A0A377G916_9GAMM|nr:glycosyltransferase [Fluoribacter dumoffii NY 23]STO21307.1 Mannosyltransferase OCH1 and related enzymes [Fluoribacter dumoffii]